MADRGALARVRGVLVPAEPRDFAGRRGVKIFLRAMHVLCAGIFAGAHVLAAAPDARASWLAATVATGMSILLLDLHETAAFLVQVRGAVVVGKLAVVATLPWWGSAQAAVLCALVVVSVVFSHAPGRVRYHVLVGRGVRASRTRG